MKNMLNKENVSLMQNSDSSTAFGLTIFLGGFISCPINLQRSNILALSITEILPEGVFGQVK